MKKMSYNTKVAIQICANTKVLTHVLLYASVFLVSEIKITLTKNGFFMLMLTFNISLTGTVIIA